MTNLPTILRTNAVPFRQIDTVFDNLFNDFFNTVSLHREIHRSAFSRWFSVDEDEYEVSNISANLVDGILSITIPKKEEAVKPLPRKIEVS